METLSVAEGGKESFRGGTTATYSEIYGGKAQTGRRLHLGKRELPHLSRKRMRFLPDHGVTQEGRGVPV